MITLSAKETIRHEVDGVTYLLAVPSMLARAAFRRDVSAMGAAYHTDGALLSCLRDGITECVATDQQGELAELIDSFEYESGQRSEKDEGTDDDEDFKDLAEQVSQIETFMRSEYPRYARMEADRGYWLSVAPIVAFRHFVTGWEGMDLKYRQRNGLVDESVLEQIPDEQVSEVGWKLLTMMRPGKEEAKNSEPQPSSQPDPETSTAEDTPQTADQAGT
jgi:hypothetical protein